MTHPRSEEIRTFVITTAYKLILRRPPDPEGLQLYQSALSNGMKLDELLRDLKESQEFLSRHTRPGSNEANKIWHCRIEPKSLPPSAE